MIKINNLYRRVIEDKLARQARYIDIDLRFAGHWFCEPGAAHNQQFVRDTKFNGVWLWNLNYFGAFLSDGHVDGGTDGNVTEQRGQYILEHIWFIQRVLQNDGSLHFLSEAMLWNPPCGTFKVR